MWNHMQNNYGLVGGLDMDFVKAEGIRGDIFDNVG